LKDCASAGEARDSLAGGGQRTLLFIDEIHRFNKARRTRSCRMSRRSGHAGGRDDEQSVFCRDVRW